MSRSGTALKFSTFDNRSNLGTFTDTIQQDDDNDQDTEIFTAIRVYCDQIIEMIDDTLARTHGFILRTLRMPKADVVQSAAMVTRLFRSVQETIAGRSQRLAANLAFEPEDKFTANYYASGLGNYPSSPIGEWPMAEPVGATAAIDYSPLHNNGVYSNVTLGEPGTGDLLTCALFNGTTSYMQLPTGFRTAFNGNAGTFGLAIKMLNSSIWTDGLNHYFVALWADNDNFYTINKETNNQVRFRIKCATLFNAGLYAQTSVDWIFLGMTWFWNGASTILTPYMNGVAQATVSVAGQFTGVPAASGTVIGAGNSTPVLVHSGWAGRAWSLNRVATPYEMARAAVVSAAGLPVNVPLIVDQVSYDFSPADFKMSLSARKWIS